MRILQLGKFYPPHRGGMETVLSALCEGLAGRGHDVRAIVASSSGAASRELIAAVDVERVRSLGSLRSVSLTPGYAAAIRRALRELDPDVVHLHLPNPVGGWSWQMAGDARPLIISYHSDIVRQRWLAKLWEPSQRRLLRQARAILLSSQALKNSSPALIPVRERCRVLPFGLDPAPFDAMKPERPENGRRYFLFVGRLVYYKGIDVLLRAIAGTELHLVIVGDGPLRGKWEAMTESLGVAEQVRFQGESTDVELRELLVRSDALVLPSTHPSESFGVVQLEAMAARRPVVAARASGGVESVQIDGETGILVEARDVEGLRRALLRLSADAALRTRMGEAARERLESNYRADSMIDGVLQIFKEARDQQL